MTGTWRWRISGAWQGDWRIGGMERGGRDQEKKQREEKEKEKKRKLYILVKRKEKTERRRNGIGVGLPHFIVLHCDLVAGERNPVSVGSSGGRCAAGPVHA